MHCLEILALLSTSEIRCHRLCGGPAKTLTKRADDLRCPDLACFMPEPHLILFLPIHTNIVHDIIVSSQSNINICNRMAYYPRAPSPYREEEPYYNSDRTYRAPADARDRDRDKDYHRSRRSPYSPSRGRSPPRDAPKGPRAFHPPPGYRARSESHDRTGGKGGGGGGYYDRDAPRSRSPSRDRDREWFGGPASRDVIIEGLGSEVDEDYVVNPPLGTTITTSKHSCLLFSTCPSLLHVLVDFC